MTTWVDLQSNDVKVVGPTGIGKSALAIEVGNQMRDKGATVSYGDVSVLSINSLPNQNLQSAGIFTLENSSQRLQQWLKWEMKHPLVIILDNCDMALASERTRFCHFPECIIGQGL